MWGIQLQRIPWCQTEGDACCMYYGFVFKEIFRIKVEHILYVILHYLPVPSYSNFLFLRISPHLMTRHGNWKRRLPWSARVSWRSPRSERMIVSTVVMEGRLCLVRSPVALRSIMPTVWICPRDLQVSGSFSNNMSLLNLTIPCSEVWLWLWWRFFHGRLTFSSLCWCILKRKKKKDEK